MLLNLVAVFFAVAVVSLDNDMFNEKLIRTPVVPATHLRGNLGTNGRFAPLQADERPEDDAETITRDAIRYVGLQETQWNLVSRYITKRSGITHITMQQQVGELMCSNCILVCNVDARGRVINLAYTAHVVGSAPVLRPQASTSVVPLQALATVVDLWNKTVPNNVELKEKKRFEEVYAAMSGLSPEDVSISLTVLVTGANESELTWRVAIETEPPLDHMYEAWVQANPSDDIPRVLQLIDLVNWDNWGNGVRDDIPRIPKSEKKAINTNRTPSKRNASKLLGVYEVYAIPHLDPTLGSRQIRTADVDETASPLGWHDQGDTQFTDTRGNNVCAQDNPTGSSTRGCINTYRPDGGDNLDFIFEFDQFGDPTNLPTKAAAVTNLFYWHNIHHDIFWQYGFDEPSGNFQENNFGLGGFGSDSVQANAQDGAGWNNANFATPIDGQRPRCRMYLWNGFNPNRDGDFDSGIIVHEIGHGVSNRLTGGAMTSGCLPSGQSGGMGEGWSDWWAVQFIQEEYYQPGDAFPMGDYVRSGGIRNYPYSYDMNINPATFGYLSRTGYTGVHAIGSVWCGILHDVYWDMRGAFGFEPDWYATTSTAGNIVLFQNVLDGLKMQPCRPTFVDARDAILLADENNYGGRHSCVMWCGFARRGLGLSARTTGYTDRNPVEGYDWPDECDCIASK